jgi:unsaturated chondroitin disaccharide hydrolase
MTTPLARALQRIDRLAFRFPEGFPSAYGEGNKYRAARNVGWTPGFWAGLLWLAYQHTGDRVWRVRAEALMPSFAARLEAGGAGTETHDLGFLYTLSAVAAWTLTGDRSARAVALRAADLLTQRFWPGGRCIQAWGRLDDPKERGRIIIDSAMNMPLLFWAAQEANRGDYRDLAVSHLDQCLRLLVRSDGSTFHTYFVDPETGEGRFGRTEQGCADASCWSRGQAWAIYGFSLAYRHTQELRFRDAATKTAAYFLAHRPADGVCFWDLTFGPDAGRERDTSAAAIGACGLLDLAAQLPPDDENRPRLTHAALGMLQTLTSDHAGTDPDEDGILRHGVCHRPLGEGVNECCLWGDYFYVEALMRRDPTWSSFW